MQKTDIPNIKPKTNVLENVIGNTNKTALIEYLIPISVFSNKSAPLQSLIRYLKEIKKVKNCDIAKTINRSQKTIYSSYIQSKDYSFNVNKNDSIKIPLLELANSNSTISENLIYFLKSKENLKTVEIAIILKRSPSCISQIHKRSIKKRYLK
ncbi:MAG TPA: hypothetical protein PLX15_02840 [Candidatus Woesearchaeota archaeon]|jgi:hypothetical protein|nr:hypothetical protein [Candidatus Woesearchaeota archaeon]